MSSWLKKIESSISNNSSSIVEIESKKEISYSQLWSESRKLSASLYSQDRTTISVLLPNSIDYIKVYLMTLLSGNTFNPLPYFISKNELTYILKYISPHTIITDRKDVLEGFYQQYNIVNVNSLLEGKKLDQAPSGNRHIKDSDIASLYYSSGTTGNPKGILYSHSNIYYLIDSICREFQFDRKTRHLAFLPFGHTASINYNIFPALFSGSPLYISEGFERLRDNFFKILADNKINYTQVVPTVLFMLKKLRPSLEGLDLSNLDFIGCGSSVLPAETQQYFLKQYGIPVANLYGLSETGPTHIDDPRSKNWVPGSIGRPLDVNQCRLSDTDGEILIKGKNVFPGYHKNKSLYESVIKDDWFHTGDIGVFEKGKLFFKDRKKDLIIKGGINITPSEVEEVIYKSEKIKECVVLGKPHELLGEDVEAFIVPRDTDVPTGLVLEIKSLCKQYLSSFKIPSKIHIVNDIPKTYSGKLSRKRIREQLSN